MDEPLDITEVEVEQLLNQPLDKEGLLAIRVDSARIGVEKKLISAERTLSEKKAQYLTPTYKGITELDRRIKLAGMVKDYQYAVDYYTSLVKLLDTKLELARVFIAK